MYRETVNGRDCECRTAASSFDAASLGEAALSYEEAILPHLLYQSYIVRQPDCFKQFHQVRQHHLL